MQAEQRRREEQFRAKQDAEEEIAWQACAQRLEQLHLDRTRTHELQRTLDEALAQVPVLEEQV